MTFRDDLFNTLDATCRAFAKENGIELLDPTGSTTLTLHLRNRLEQAGVPRGDLVEMVETLIAERNLLRQELAAAQAKNTCLTRSE